MLILCQVVVKLNTKRPMMMPVCRATCRPSASFSTQPFQSQKRNDRVVSNERSSWSLNAGSLLFCLLALNYRLWIAALKLRSRRALYCHWKSNRWRLNGLFMQKWCDFFLNGPLINWHTRFVQNIDSFSNEALLCAATALFWCHSDCVLIVNIMMWHQGTK